MLQAYRNRPVNPFLPADAPGDGIPLRDYLADVGKKVKEVGVAWVVAEVESVKHHPSGHVYLDLVGSETGKDGSAVKVASARARIWKSNAPGILGWFAESTGRKLERGLTVLVKVSPDFHAAYGFNLNIHDIDPRFTLGDMEARIAAIRKLLVAGFDVIGHDGFSQYRQDCKRLREC
jgi:exonuclease VII large subunit